MTFKPHVFNWLQSEHAAQRRFDANEGISMGTSQAVSTATTNTKLLSWVDEMATLLKPDHVRWCDGSDDEFQESCNKARALANNSFFPATPTGPM